MDLGDEQYCYLTTTGRISGEPREIEIWFALRGTVLYMLSGGREKSHWVRNISKTPAVRVRIAGQEWAGNGRFVAPDTDEDALARKLLVEKYRPAYSSDLSEWGRTSLPVAIDLAAPSSRLSAT